MPSKFHLRQILLLASIFLLATVACAKNEYNLEIADSAYVPINESYIGISNMPKVIRQSSAGICYAASTAVLFDEAMCASNRIKDCKSLPDSEKVSVLDVLRYARVSDIEIDEIKYRSSYQGLEYDGGSPVRTIFAMLYTQSSASEACAPQSQVLSKNHNPVAAQREELAMWADFQSTFNRISENKNNIKEFSSRESTRLKEKYELKGTLKEIERAFDSEDYKIFLDRLLIPRICSRAKNSVFHDFVKDFEFYPSKKFGKSNFNNTIKKIKEVLKLQRPISISYCYKDNAEYKNIKSCEEGMATHTAVIHGYRQSCNSSKQCIDELQVQNSWGEEWQEANNDGWVKAKPFLDRSFYEVQSLAWILLEKSQK